MIRAHRSVPLEEVLRLPVAHVRFFLASCHAPPSAPFSIAKRMHTVPSRDSHFGLVFLTFLRILQVSGPVHGSFFLFDFRDREAVFPLSLTTSRRFHLMSGASRLISSCPNPLSLDAPSSRLPRLFRERRLFSFNRLFVLDM